MIRKKSVWLCILLAAVIFIQLIAVQPVHSASGTRIVKELNFVFLHGMGGNPCTFQNLADQIEEIIPYFIDRYNEKYPHIEVRVNTMARCYPGYTDINSWANNIADSINEHFADKDNLILVGHSMGGKTALYTVAHNTGNISDKVAAVITINSPVKNLNDYYVPGGGPMLDYCRTTLLGSDEGICNSLAFYDSSEDGLKISREKHWLAFVSAEESPLSPQYDRSGFDIWPRNMDDGVVPLSAQFADGADVVYYGEHGHSDVGNVEDTTMQIANTILFYIFGYPIEFSELVRTGTLDHEADWLMGTDRWSDIVGGTATGNGTITHTNKSFFQWQEWQDIIGDCSLGDERSYSHIHLSSLPVLTGIKSANWVDSENSSDCRLRIITSASPLTTVKVEWTVFSAGLFPEGKERSFYDVEIYKGTPFATITRVSWWKDNPLNPVIWIRSEAQSPFRWFEAKWSIYQKDTREVRIIDELRITTEEVVQVPLQ